MILEATVCIIKDSKSIFLWWKFMGLLLLSKENEKKKKPSKLGINC